MKTSLNDIDFPAVCQVITGLLGLNFPEDRWNILRSNLVLAAHQFGFQQLDEFIRWLLTASLNKSQVENLASHLTISETYFWREPKVFAALTDFILPDLYDSRKNHDKSIRIWSAGCATGEEPYSLAIALHQAIPDIKDWKIRILATDINPKALAKAATGIYTQWSFRNCPSWLKPLYFRDLKDGKYEIIPEIKQMVTFANQNLTKDFYLSKTNQTNNMDIIFCRNVLMYFTSEWVSSISQNLFHSLKKEGWLVVSSCELSSQVFPQFKSVNFSGAQLYRKGNSDLSFSPEVFTPVPNSEYSLPGLNIPSNWAESGLHQLTAMPVVETYRDTALLPATDQPAVPENEPVKSTIAQINLLANMGHLDEALIRCNDAIKSDKLATGLYFVRASIQQELDQTSDAIASLKQAIYLDHNFIMAHFVLGNLYFRLGKQKDANRQFTNVTDLLSTLSDGVLPPESGGLSVEYIRQISQSNMQKLNIS